MRLERPGGGADATLTADSQTWSAIADGVDGGMRAFRSGRLAVRRNLHVGVGFLAATSGVSSPGRLRFRTVVTGRMRLSTLEAGVGPPVLAIHGLGATKGSFVFTVAALADRFRVIAADLPGFGDSDKPIGAAYDAPFFAGAMIDLLDALELEPRRSDRKQPRGPRRAGGRPASSPARRPRGTARALVGLATPRRWAPALRLVRPELGLVQLAPRAAVQAVVHRLIPGADEGWTAAGVDEFLRAYLTPAGRAAFYAAARQIYLEAPHGKRRFLAQVARAPARCPVHLGSPRHAGSDRVRAACRRGSPAGPSRRVGLRARAADGAAPPDTRRSRRVSRGIGDRRVGSSRRHRSLAVAAACFDVRARAAAKSGARFCTKAWMPS